MATDENNLDAVITAAKNTENEDQQWIASHWTLVWWRFKRHQLAMGAAVVIALFYVIALSSEFLATQAPRESIAEMSYAPPQSLNVEFTDGTLRPFVYGIKSSRDPETYAMAHTIDKTEKYYITYFARNPAYAYKFWGLFCTDRHLMVAVVEDIEMPAEPDCTVDNVLTKTPRNIYVLGTDRMGRDMWSRIMLGTRISMSIGLVGVAISLIIGIFMGGISGLRGGWTDLFIQRLIEQLRAMPTIPLWLALAAAVPADWSITKQYFAIVVILSVIGWTTLAREVRGRFLAMREEDFVLAARLYGSGQIRIIFRHMLPSFVSHIIASISLSIPGIILAETSLSFLGLGMRPPAISWGVLLKEAQNVRTVDQAPWLLLPGVFVVIAVLAFNFLGDGLRDAADPYSNRN